MNYLTMRLMKALERAKVAQWVIANCYTNELDDADEINGMYAIIQRTLTRTFEGNESN